MRILALHLFVCLSFILRAQPGTTVVNTAVGNGDYKDQQYVKLQTPNGKVTPTGIGEGHLFIDKNVIIQNTANSSPNNFNNLPAHDKNLQVGTLDGMPNVDLNGAANYSIKLDIPPGTNGVSPDISINYNSNGADNQLGLGWSIGGVSVIKREHGNIFSDNKISQMDPNCTTFWSATPGNVVCPLYMDGVKLVPEQSSSNTFNLENDNFSKITYDAANSYFVVETKAGLKMEYGRNSSVNSSLKKIVTNTKDYAWYINKIYDNYGNYMEYFYHNINNEIALKEIKYTGNSTSGQVPYNSIKFYYNNKLDPKTKYFYDDVVKQELQLREIETFCEGVSVFRYSFTYAYEDFNYLSEVTKIASNGANLNPTHFAYGNNSGPKLTQNAAQLKSGSTSLSPTQDYITADFNNDGKTDIIEFHILGTIDPNNGYKMYDSWKLFLNTNNGQEFQQAQFEQLGPSNPAAPKYAAAYSASYGYMSGLHANPNAIEIGDINGDGFMDLVYGEATNNNYAAVIAYTFNPTTNMLSPMTLPLSHNNSCDNNFFAFRMPGSSSFYNSVNSSNSNVLVSNPPGSTSMSMGDFNGDGKSELLTYFKKPGDATSEVCLFFFSSFQDPAKASFTGITELYSIHKIASANLVTQLSGGSPISLNNYSGFSAVDYNGDGKTDLIAYKNAESATNIKFVVLEVNVGVYSIETAETCNLTFKEIAAYPVASSLFPADHASSGDFNGDGYTDFINHPFITGLQSSISFGTGKSFTAQQNCNNIGLRGLKKKFLGLDVNADGISDLVKLETYTNLNVTAEVILGQNITKNVPFTSYGVIGTGNDNFCGMPNNKDYLHPYCDYDYDGNSNNVANCINPNQDPDDMFDQNPSDIPFYSTGDFDGDGYNDIIYRKACLSGPIFQIIYFKDKYGTKSLTSVVDGLNKRTDFAYSTTAKTNYTKSNDVHNYPTVRMNYPCKIVTAMTFTNAANLNGSYLSETVNYFYEDLLINKLGKGFLGFKKVTKVDNLTNRSSIETFTIIPDYFIKLPYQNKTFSAAQILSTTTYTYDVVNKNVIGVLGQSMRKRYQVRLTNIAETNHIRNITTNTSKVFDIDGNVTQSSTIIPGKKQVITDYLNYVNAGSWMVNKPQIITTQTSYSGVTPFQIKQVNYNYDVTKGHVNTETTDISTQKSIVTTKTYDSNTGSLLQSVISAPNDPSSPTSITTINQYDSKFRFITVQLSALGYQKSIDYNFKLGAPLKTVDIDGLTTNMFYDAFGRLTKIIDPNGNSTNTNMYWYTSANVQSGDPHPVNPDLTIYYTEIKQLGAPMQRIYYDLDNRKVKTDVEGFNGNVSELIDYDIYGNVKKESGPFFVPPSPGVPIVIKTNNYSVNLNELLSVNVNDGTINNTTNFAYNYVTSTGEKIITTTDPAGKITTKKIDKADMLIAATDNGGTLDYTYYSNLKLNETKLNGAVIKKMNYDPFDFLYQEIEKNSGTKQYNYNAFGQLMSFFDAKNTTYSYAYDVLGRMTTETIGLDSYYFTYINSGNGKGKIDNILTTNGTQFTYFYDNFGRVIQSDEKINSVTYSNKYTYDNFYRLTKQVYPNNFTIKRNYNNLGYATTIVQDGTNDLLWRADELDHFGNYTKYTKGNNIQTVHAYNGIGMPKSIIAGNVQNLVLDINSQTGNLEKITDNVKGNIEEFQYDNLDRLNQTKLNSINPLTINFDNKGNITSKFDAGNMIYDPLKHNQVKDVGNANNIISNIQQDITYTLFDKVKHIAEGINELDVTYGPGKDRMQTEFIQNGLTIKRRLYISETEIELDNNGNITQSVNYIHAPNGLCALHVKQGVSENVYYPYFNHIGSILTLTNKFANVVAEQNFDAWGRRRNATTWLYSSLNSLPTWLTRGYTGHEALEDFDLINMNGRLYDPKLGRMLSVDPVLQDNKSTQAYNKYSYCLNNPLKYTDPSGYQFQNLWGNTGAGSAHKGGLGNLVTPGSRSNKNVNDGGNSAIWGPNFDGNPYNNSYGNEMFGPPEHIFRINAKLLASEMHTGSKNNALNSVHEGKKNDKTNFAALPIGWGVGILLPEVEIVTDGKGNFSKPSYDIWAYANSGPSNPEKNVSTTLTNILYTKNYYHLTSKAFDYYDVTFNMNHQLGQQELFNFNITKDGETTVAKDMSVNVFTTRFTVNNSGSVGTSFGVNNWRYGVSFSRDFKYTFSTAYRGDNGVGGSLNFGFRAGGWTQGGACAIVLGALCPTLIPAVAPAFGFAK